jgi:predicted RNA binding protein YcfA (HicA-like mRNA interferase family)
MKVKEVIRRLEDEGWVFDRQGSSHRTFKNAGAVEIIIVSDLDSKDVTGGWK